MTPNQALLNMAYACYDDYLFPIPAVLVATASQLPKYDPNKIDIIFLGNKNSYLVEHVCLMDGDDIVYSYSHRDPILHDEKTYTAYKGNKGIKLYKISSYSLENFIDKFSLHHTFMKHKEQK